MFWRGITGRVGVRWARVVLGFFCFETSLAMCAVESSASPKNVSSPVAPGLARITSGMDRRKSSKEEYPSRWYGMGVPVMLLYSACSLRATTPLGADINTARSMDLVCFNSLSSSVAAMLELKWRSRALEPRPLLICNRGRSVQLYIYSKAKWSSAQRAKQKQYLRLSRATPLHWASGG